LILQRFHKNLFIPVERDHSGNNRIEEEIKVLPDTTSQFKRKENLLSL
jgi:hypothetical protein